MEMQTLTTTNSLAQEKSPYLLQHKHNPVQWYPWGKEAFALAEQFKKPIFLSIGYSTCYWCHVMESESFEDKEVAQVLNEQFVCIKVDREERPDVDKIYMDAVMAMTQHGGWPLSVFLTPELKPFYGGTYFPKPQFLQILAHINKLWTSERDQILGSSHVLTEALNRRLTVKEQVELGPRVLEQFFAQMRSNYDYHHGGFGGAPKFPPSVGLSLLLRFAHNTSNDEAMGMVTHTLESMARGGIYDHIGGGFARYSTDEKWLVPHFEKMLYDNALLSFGVFRSRASYGCIAVFLGCSRDIGLRLAEYVSP